MATFDIKELLTWCEENNIRLDLSFRPWDDTAPTAYPYMTVTVRKWSEAQHTWCYKRKIIFEDLLDDLDIVEFKFYVELMAKELCDEMNKKDRGWQESMELKRKTLIEPDPPMHKYSKENDDEG